MEEKIKILLCEDDENLGMLLREYLQAKGFTTVLCPDGEVGYKEFNKNKFDIAVLDVMMPKKDGFTLAQEIRQTNADLPIIFLTAKTLKEDTAVLTIRTRVRNTATHRCSSATTHSRRWV